jgi:hypothetical protein
VNVLLTKDYEKTLFNPMKPTTSEKVKHLKTKGKQKE